MSNGKTYWWAKDAAWLDREGVVELGEEFGPAGPLVLDALCGMAKLENDAGHVLTGWRALARKAFVTPDDARAVVRHAFQIGALDDLDEHADGRRFRCRVSGWQSDQSRGYEAVKKQLQRTGKRNPGEGHVPSQGTVSRNVPLQDRTGKKETPKSLSRHNETPRAPVNLVRIDQEEVA